MNIFAIKMPYFLAFVPNNALFCGMISKRHTRTLFHVFLHRTGVWMILVLLWIGGGRAYADTEFALELLTTLDGLANNTVRHIMQDSRGSYWFSTSNGLSRYADGLFTNYHPDRHGHLPGLPDQRVRYVMEDAQERLWINTVGGWCCFDLVKNTFVDYAARGWNTPLDTICIVKEICVDGSRLLRVTDNDGLYIINKDGQREHFTTTSASNPLPTNALKCICRDKDGTLWVGTDNLGVMRLTMMPRDRVEVLLEGEHLRMLARLADNRMAVSNKRGDVWVFDDSFKQQISHVVCPNNTYCMASTDGNKSEAWRGTKGGGLYCGGDSIEGIPHDEIYTLLLQGDTTLWVGTFGGGLLRYNTITHQVTLRLLDDTYGSKRVRKLVETRDHALWVATSDGVFVLKQDIRRSGEMKVVEHLNVANGQLNSDEVRTLYQDSRGRMFIAETGVGFAIWDRGKLEHYTCEDSLVNDMVQCFVEDEDGFVWIATELGISRFNPATRSFKSFFFSKNLLNNVYSENCGARLSDGRIAFGSNNGILLIDVSFYNAGETTQIGLKDMTVAGGAIRHDIVYIMRRWWKSPWFYMFLAAFVATCTWMWHRFKRREKSLNEQNVQLSEQKDLLMEENVQLSEQKEQLTQDIQIRREEDMDAQDKEFVIRLQTIAETHLAHSDFSADDFASEMGLGRTIFYKRMKQSTGYSPKEYLKQRRIHQAAYLLSTTTLTVAQIADRVGINDSLYLSRVFKAEYKCTPTEWRRRGAEAER